MNFCFPSVYSKGIISTVFEPYRGERYISNISPVEIQGNIPDGEAARAVKVTFAEEDRVDYIVYATDNSELYTVTDNGKTVFEFRGFVGVYSINSKGTLLYSYVHDGNKIGELEENRNAYKGTVVSFNKELSPDNYIDAALDCDDLSILPGKYVFIENDGLQNAVYKIESASENEDGTVRLDIGTVTLIRGHKDVKNADSGYIYNIKEEQTFEIPVSHTDDSSPIVSPLSDTLSTSVGSSVTINIDAESPIEGKTLKYIGTTLPRGVVINEETGSLTWTPTASQVGENHIAVTVKDDDGRATTVHFTITVYGSTSGGTSGGGGGGGAGAPSEPTTPDKPDTPEEPTTPDVPQTPSVDTETRFIDLGNYDWAEDAINALADEGIIKGTSENTFAPGNNITRADFAILLVRAFELESDNLENFSDVNANDYFASELAIARNAGIVGGIGDNKYAPKNNITRQDMMVIVYRALTGMNKLNVGDGVLDVPQASDFDKVADYAKEAVSALVNAKLVNGKGDKIAPADYTTRAEVAVLLKRILDYTK